MKRLILALTILYSFSAMADELPRLIKSFSELGRPEASQCTEVDYQACAKALCGKSELFTPKPLENYNAKTYGDVKSVKAEMTKVLLKRRVENSKRIVSLKVALPLKLKTHIAENWKESDWDRQIIAVMEPFLKIEFKDNELKILVKPDAVVPVGFIDNLKRYYKRYPNQLKSLGVIDEATFEKLHKESYQETSFTAGDLCFSDECKKLVIDNQNKWALKKLQKLEDNNLDNKLLEEQAIKCLSNHIHYGILSERTNKFKGLLPEVQKDFLTNGLAGLSDHSKKSFEEYLKKNLALEFGVRSPLELLKESQLMDSIKIEKSLLKQVTDENPTLNPFEHVAACESQLDVQMFDAFLYLKKADKMIGIHADIAKKNKKDTLFVSQKTCRHSEVGKGVVAHELAHALSYAFADKRLSEGSYKEYMEDRECATRQSNKSSEEVYEERHAGDRSRTEEDTADLISFKTYQDSSVYGGCFLLNNKAPYDKLNTKVPQYNFDTHSTSFVRLIREAIHKKIPAPTECHKVIEEYRANYQDNETCI